MDARRIERILRNLLVNAIEHSEGEADRHPDRERRRGGGHRGPRSRRRVRGQPGQAGLPPVLAGRPGPGPDRGRHRAGPGDRDGGRQPARRLADRVGPARAGRPVPADRAAQGRGHPGDVAAAAGAARHRRAMDGPATVPSDPIDGRGSSRRSRPRRMPHARIRRLPASRRYPAGATTVCADALPSGSCSPCSARSRLAGCVAVPTTGPVERIEGQQPACQNCVNVEVAPPEPGDEPGQIVEGYLRATSNYQPNYAVAKQFLTKSAAGEVEPGGRRVHLPRSARSPPGTKVHADGDAGRLAGPDRTYTARDRKLKVDFGLVKENGEWRISKPPPRADGGRVLVPLLLPGLQPVLHRQRQRPLVPDPIYLPTLRSPAERRLGADEGAAQRPVRVAEAGGDQRHPDRRPHSASTR